MLEKNIYVTKKKKDIGTDRLIVSQTKMFDFNSIIHVKRLILFIFFIDFIEETIGLLC